MLAVERIALIVSVLLVLGRCEERSRVVETEQGPVRGYLGDEGYYQFYGIPYATAPRGDHKFKAPLQPSGRRGVLEATSKVVCPQFAFPVNHTAPSHQDEDCLVANVFVPKTEKTNLPVIVYVHGGAFLLGSGDMADHQLLVRNEVIVVNFNYRLGVYGFLCLGTKDIPGNAGMKDQVAALRWIKENIVNFGGNPDDITIAGYSAGSAAVEHLMLSPMAKGLFTKVIPESGSALSPWAITPDPIAVAKRYMQDIASYSSDDIVELEDFYKSLTTEQLTEKIYLTEPQTSFEFVPCVEPYIEGEESFYNESPLDILKSGHYNKVPMMPGFATEEGLFRIDQFDVWSGKMEENFADFLPQDLVFESVEIKKHVAEKVKRFYFGERSIKVSFKEYVDYFTDIIFGYSTVKSAQLHAQNSVPVYLYDYSYVLSTKLPHAHSDKVEGANHCAQTLTLNKFRYVGPLQYSKEDILMQKRLAKMWTNFAKNGKPTPQTYDLLPVAWEPVDQKKLNYLHIDLEMKMAEHLLGDRFRLWDSIYREYYRKPHPPGRIPKTHEEL